MNTINIKSINFDLLSYVSYLDYSESDIYHNDNRAYKIYRKMPKKNLIQKELKLKALEEINDFYPIVKTTDKIINDDNHFKGIGMNYFPGRPLWDIDVSSQPEQFFDTLKDVSQSLRKIHHDPLNIVIGDASFNNILVNKEGKHCFVDSDSMGFDGIPIDMISSSLSFYLKSHHLPYIESQRSDKLSLFIEAYEHFFDSAFHEIKEEQIIEQKETIPFMKNSHTYFKMLQTGKYTQPDIPYLDEFIRK